MSEEPQSVVAEPVEEKAEIKSLTLSHDPAEMAHLEEAARTSERRRALITKILLDCTYETDWVRMGEYANLTSAGAERVAMAIGGFSWEPVRVPECRKWSDKHGKAYSWTFHMRVKWRGGEATTIGVYSTRDKFLGYANEEWRDSDDILEANVMKAAFHNAIGEGIKGLLGLRRMPASVLPDHGKAGAKGVEFGTKKKGGKGGRGAPKESEHDKRQKLALMLQEINGGDLEAAQAHLAELTRFEGRDGQTKEVYETAKLSGPWLDATYGKARKAYEEWQKTRSTESSPAPNVDVRA